MSSLDPDHIASTLQTWMNNFTNQTHSAFARLTPKDVFRMVAVVGGYALIIRPLLIKLGARIQAQQHERDAKDGEQVETIDPRTGLPRKMAIPGVDSDSDEDMEGVKADAAVGEWGRKARLRQRRIVRTAMEVREGELLADDDDDIKEFLQD
jgi:Protein trafficking PGA2